MTYTRTAVTIAAVVAALGQGAGARADHDPSGRDVAHGIALLVGGPVIAGSTLYDIGKAPASAKRYNERSVSLTPIVDMQRREYGMSIAWSFGAKQRALPERRFSGRRSPAAAFAISTLATAVPIALGARTAHKSDLALGLMSAGIVLGPSAGHVYAGQHGRGALTAAMRLGAGTAVWGLSGCDLRCAFSVGD
jgi:hypothetical protein